VGQRFQRGVVLYTGVELLPFGQRFHALPVQALWRLGNQTEQRRQIRGRHRLHTRQ
jgi:uncharacterized protein